MNKDRETFHEESWSTSLFNQLFKVKHLPRWIIYSIDLFIAAFAFLVTYFLMAAWGIAHPGGYSDTTSFLITFGVTVFFLTVFRVARGVVRHSTIMDVLNIALAVFFTFITLFLIGFISEKSMPKKILYSPPLFFYSLILFLGLSAFRLLVKFIFSYFNRIRNSDLGKDKKVVLVFGIDEESVAFGSALNEGYVKGYSLKGFLNPLNGGSTSRILGKPVYSFQKIKENPLFLQDVNAIIFPEKKIRDKNSDKWFDFFIQHNIKILTAPINEVDRNKGYSQNKIKNLEIEDLLYREQISIENKEISKRHLQKNVLVTGGAGSIGSEIVRQVASFKPDTIVIVDQAETPLHNLELELTEKFPNQKFIFHLADVSNKYRIETLFKKYNFSMVYHAAAYKHVPMIERNPHEAIFVNIVGSRILADLSHKYNINRFVLISTDKAVNPTNVMGASKRAAELYVQSLQYKDGNKTKFITTRFGNVLGSNGSVIPTFRKQIEKGGPVTVTHKEITRYFMTIPEACELVLQAGTMGQGGEIYVFDMGEPVKIYDLAKKMIRLSGFEPEIEIPISITGLRPGEKLYEELLSDKTKTLPTHHEKIMRAQDETMKYSDIEKLTKEIAKGTLNLNKMELVTLLKEIVPEYISKNSTFEALDKNNPKYEI